MSEEAWHAARLIPTSGIKGAEEQERRATSALLAVLTAVKEFGRTVTGRAGAFTGVMECFVEVPFVLGDREVSPDGLIRVTRGKRTWTALVEVKTGANLLQREQLEAYLDVAKEQGFNALLTISNEIPATPGAHPTEVDKRKLRKVELHHLSWTQILTDAVMEKLYRGVADPDQAWILGELIRYLEHPRSGAMELDDMGAGWVPVREAVRAGTLRAHDKAAQEVAARWDQLVRFASLRLGRQLGTEVAIAMPRKELMDPALRTQHLLDSLITTGCLEGALRILETVGPVRVRADLRAGQLFASVDIDAPRDGRPQTRINWLVRQLKEAPDTLRIEAFAAHQRASTADLLRQVRADPTVLIGDPKKEIKSFTVTMNSPLGAKRGAGRGGFVASVLDLLDDFYGSTVQNLKPWSAPAPKLRKPAPEDADGQVLTSTALSSQDGPDPSYASHAAPEAVAETPASPAE
jgi:hypothetical protein